MSDAALFIGWDRPIPGKEPIALELFAMARSYFDDQKKKGVIESYEPVLLTAHAGDLNGFMLIRCSFENLSKLRRDENFLALITRCTLALQGFGVVDAYRGGSLEQILELYRQNL